MPGTPWAGTHYNDTSIAEDVSNIIYQITPEDTPFYNMTGDTSATAVTHEWQRRALTVRQHNANPEGFTYTFTAQNNYPTRVSNVTQIFEKDVRVSNTQEAIMHHAIDSVFADQTKIKMAEYKTDCEHTLIKGTLASGATNSSRQMIGMIQAIISGISTYTDGQATASMSETTFNGIIQTCWDLGGEPRDVFVGGTGKRHISTYTGSSTKFIPSADRQIINTVDTYISDFFPVRVHLSRDIPKAGDAHLSATSLYSGFGFLFVDSTMVRKVWLRKPVVKRVPETADSMDGVIVGEKSLEWGHPNAHYYVSRFNSTVA